MKPHLLCLNLNGMTRGGDKAGKKILPIGAGRARSGAAEDDPRQRLRGPIGILNHTDEDAEARLDNIEGLDGSCRSSTSLAAARRCDAATSTRASDYWAVEDAAARASAADVPDDARRRRSTS